MIDRIKLLVLAGVVMGSGLCADVVRVGLYTGSWAGASMRTGRAGLPEKVADHLVETLEQEGFEGVAVSEEDLLDAEKREALDVIFLPGGWRSYGFSTMENMLALTDFVAGGKGVLAGIFRSGPFTHNNRPLFPQVGQTYFKSDGMFIFPVGESSLVNDWNEPYCVKNFDHTVQRVGPDGHVFAVDSGGEAVGVYGEVFGGRYLIWGSFLTLPVTAPLEGLHRTIFINCVRWLAGAPERSPAELARDRDVAKADLLRRFAHYDWLLDDSGPDSSLGVLYQVRSDIELQLLARLWQLDTLSRFLPEDADELEVILSAEQLIKGQLDMLRRNYTSMKAVRENEINGSGLEALVANNPYYWTTEKVVELLSAVPVTPGNEPAVKGAIKQAERGRKLDGKWLLKTIYGHELSERMLPENELSETLSVADKVLADIRPAAIEARANSVSVAFKQDADDVPGLLEQCAAENAGVRAAAVLELGRIGDARAVDVLIKLIADPVQEVRINAIQALGWMRAEKSVPALIKAVSDDDQWIRRRAVQALGQIGNPRAEDVLIGAMEDSDFHVRQNAVLSLGWLKSKKAVEPLIELTGKGDRENPYTRELMIAANRALGHIGDKRALPALEHWRDTANDQPAFRGKPIVNLYTLSGTLGLEGTARLAIADIEAGGKETRGIRQPGEMRSPDRFYGLSRSFNMLAGRAPGGARRLFDFDGDFDLDAFFSSIIAVGGNGVNCGWIRDRMDMDPQEYKELVTKAGEYGIKWIETMPGSAHGLHHGAVHRYKHYLGGYGANMGKPTVEMTLVDYQDIPALQGFWQEETGPSYKLEIPEVLREFENYLTAVYGENFRSELGLKPDEPLTGEGVDEDNRKLRIAKRDFQHYMRREEWREAQQWLKGVRQGCTFFWNPGGGHVESGDISEAIDGAGLEAYLSWEPRETMHAALTKDGEARAVQAEYYTFRDPSLRHSELGFSKHLMHGEAYFPWSFYRILQPDPYVWYWQQGRWDVLSSVFNKGRRLEEYIAGAASGARVAMVYSRAVQDRFGEGHGKRQPARYDQHMLGIWMMLQQSHIPSDAIWTETFTPEKLARYDALVLADTGILDPDQTRMISDWVEQGGVLVATGFTSLFNSWGEPMENYALADVFGVEYVGHRDVADPQKSDTFAFESASEVGKQAVKVADEGLDLDKIGRYVHREIKPVVSMDTYSVSAQDDSHDDLLWSVPGASGSSQKEMLWAIPSGFSCEYDMPLGYSLVKLRGAGVLASFSNGDPALTVNRFGNGVCYLWTPAYPGLSYVAAEIGSTPLYFKFWPGVRELFAGMLRGGLNRIGAELPVEVTSCPLEVEVTVRSFPEKRRIVIHLLNYDLNNDVVRGVNILARPPELENATVYYPDTGKPVAGFKTRGGIAFGLRDFRVHDMVVVEY